MNIDDLIAIEEIKALRAKYSLYFDARDADRLAGLFSADAVCAFPAEYGGDWTGRDAIRTRYAEIMLDAGEQFGTMDCASNPLIEITGPTRARGVWYLVAFATQQDEPTSFVPPGGSGNPLLDLGVYEDEYVKSDGTWRFVRIKLHTFWPERSFQGLEHTW